MSVRTPTPRPDPTRFEEQIRGYEAQDRSGMPAADGILFVGSSSIVLWDVKAAFPHLPVINRGFGGSVWADAVYYFDRIIPLYRPATVVLYAGDNDAANNLSPQEIFDDFETLVGKIFAALPAARVICLPTKPSIARWNLDEIIRAFNAMMESFARTDDRLRYADVYHPMLGVDNKPRAELYAEDGLHMTPAGYEVWNGVVGPYLENSRA